MNSYENYTPRPKGANASRGADLFLASSMVPLASVTPIAPPRYSESMARRVGELRGQSIAKNTTAAYESAWRIFSEWCAENDQVNLPAHPRTLMQYLVEKADTIRADGSWRYAIGSLNVWISAINKVHDMSRLPRPGNDLDVTELMHGISRQLGRPKKQASPLTLDRIKLVLRAIQLIEYPKGLIGHRDYAIILLGFAGAFRRSELTELKLESVTVGDVEGLNVYLRTSKTDQFAEGFTKGIPAGTDPATCPPCALVRWRRLLGVARRTPTRVPSVLQQTQFSSHVCLIDDLAVDDLPLNQPLFPAMVKGGRVTTRQAEGSTVNAIVKLRAAAAGLEAEAFSGHSLRAGFVTQAYRSGATTHEVMRQTGHKSPAMVEVYSRELDPLLHNAALKLGL